MKTHAVVSADEAVAKIRSMRPRVIGFAGYSACGYANPVGVEAAICQVLAEECPVSCLIVAGATACGIGCVYPIAKSKGFMTCGVVSSLVLSNPDALSAHVDSVLPVSDATWGGMDAESGKLYPVSEAFVRSCDRLIFLGGGPVSRAEYAEAVRRGVLVEWREFARA